MVYLDDFDKIYFCQHFQRTSTQIANKRSLFNYNTYDFAADVAVLRTVKPTESKFRYGISGAITHSDDFEKVYVGGALVGFTDENKWKPVILITDRDIEDGTKNLVALENLQAGNTGFSSHTDFPLVEHLIVSCDTTNGAGKILGTTSNRDSGVEGNMVYAFALHTSAGSQCVPTGTDVKWVF